MTDTNFSVSSSVHDGVLASYDANHDSQVAASELSKLPPETAALLIKQSFSAEPDAPAAYGQPPVLGPMNAGVLDRQATVRLIGAAVPPDTLGRTMASLDAWGSAHPQEHKAVARGLYAELGPARYAQALEGIVAHGYPPARATVWMQALGRAEARQVEQELAAHSRPDTVNPLLAKPLAQATVDLFRDGKRVVVLGELHTPSVKSEKPLAEMMPVMAAAGVKRLTVELPSTEQEALTRLAAGSDAPTIADPQKMRDAADGITRGETAKPGLLVQLYQKHDPEWVGLVRAAHQAGIKVEAIDMPNFVGRATPELSRKREQAMADAVAASPEKTLVLTGSSHAVQGIRQAEAPLASRLNQRNIPTGSVKLESFSAAVALREMGASIENAGAANQAYIKLVKSPESLDQSFSYPTEALGDMKFYQFTPRKMDPLGMPTEPRYRDSFDQVFVLKPEDS